MSTTNAASSPQAPAAASASAAAAALSAADRRSSADRPHHTFADPDERRGGLGGGGAMSSSASLDDHLDDLLSSPDFTVAGYLNFALDPTSFEGHGKAHRAPSSGFGSSSDSDDDDDGGRGGRYDSKRAEEDEDDLLQRRMAELALQLQIKTQGCHDEIGRIGAELRAVLPRCAADVGRIEIGLRGVRDDAEGLLWAASGSNAAGVAAESSKGGGSSATGGGESKDAGGGADAAGGEAPAANSTPPPLETLSTLHALRSNLALTRSILAAAAGWDETISSIPSLLSTSSLAEAASALARLEHGARALRGMPGVDERRDAIAKIRGQIEVLLRPQLLHALQRMDTRLGPLQQCVVMYKQLGKERSLKEEYVKQRPGGVHRAWFAYSSSAPRSTSGVGGGSEHGSDVDVPTSGLEEGAAAAADVEGAGGSDDPAAAFVSWLPTWYEAVLSLLAEERRRSRAVFGSATAPEVMARVLAECFRPILPSFKARLASIYPPDGADSSSGPVRRDASNVSDASSTASSSDKPTGSLESICAAYQATLQFLSLAYDQMAGWEADAAPTAPSTDAAGSGSSGDDENAHRTIRSTFATVASPFAPYQSNFASLERSHSGSAARMVARDVQGAVSGRDVGLTLSSLQDAVERLEDLAPFMFPLAEAAVVRFELLNSGYRAPSALSTVDSLLCNHIGELAIAIGTLSANMTADGDRLADGFDEQHVQCSLEVLKVAGALRRTLRSFEGKTRERLRVLCGRMRASAAHDVDMGGSNSSSGGGPSALPDSLSAVEVQAMLARAVCDDGSETDDGRGVMTSSSLVTLQRLASSDRDGALAISLFPDSVEAMSRLANSCHSFVFDVCSAVPHRHLRNMSSMSVWREEGSGGSGVDSYGILPQQYITAVGEHMLALVQALEPFASSGDALDLAKEVMDGVKDVAIQPWKEFAAATGSSEGSKKDVIISLMNGKVLADVLDNTDQSFEEDEDEDGVVEDPSSKESAAFCNEWLDVVGSAVTGRLLERALRISQLSQKGCEHLAADLNYIVNVFSALGVSGHPHPLLSHFGGLAAKGDTELKEEINSRNRNNAIENVLRAAEVRIALMRGISAH